jgi:hypothetical protein
VNEWLPTHDETEICLVQNDYVDDFNDERFGLLGVTAWPTIAGDGVTDIWPTSCLDPTLAQRAAIPSPMTIDISEQGEGQFTAHLYAEEAIVGGQFFMVATLDEYVPSYGGGQSHLPRHVKLHKTDPATGDPITMSAGESMDISWTFAVESGWDYETMGVAAWVSRTGGTDGSPCTYGPLGSPHEVLQSRWIAASADLTGVGDPIPAALVSMDIVPNPFNPRTHVKYTLGETSRVTLQVFDLSGRLVDTLASGGIQEAGSHTVLWQGRDAKGNELPSGVYLCRITADSEEQTKRMVLIR